MGIKELAMRMGANPQMAHVLEQVMLSLGIDTPLRISHFLGQLAAESGGFKRTIESMNYSVEGLMRTFSRKRISAQDCARLGRTQGRAADQKAIANLVYGGNWGRINLGNFIDGDGWKFRGHGLMQTTGRGNVTNLSRGMFSDNRLADNPFPIAQIALCVESAGFYWRTRDCNSAADRNDAIAVTKKINPGLHGIDLRIERTKFAQRMLG